MLHLHRYMAVVHHGFARVCSLKRWFVVQSRIRMCVSSSSLVNFSDFSICQLQEPRVLCRVATLFAAKDDMNGVRVLFANVSSHFPCWTALTFSYNTGRIFNATEKMVFVNLCFSPSPPHLIPPSPLPFLLQPSFSSPLSICLLPPSPLFLLSSKRAHFVVGEPDRKFSG